jgi:hypothetical protein
VQEPRVRVCSTKFLRRLRVVKTLKTLAMNREMTMKKYKVTLDGQNFEIEFDGKVQRLGFFTTRWVEAVDSKEAELKAVELVKNDELLAKSICNKKDNPPMIYLSELLEMDSFDNINVPGGGYSFYPDKDNKSR